MAQTQAFTEEQETLILQVRLMIGDSPSSPFYPLFQDEEIAQFLSMNGWRLRPAIRMAAIAASMQFAQYTYRERSGDIEVWNNISIQYQKALQTLITESGTAYLPDGLMPYFGGISFAAKQGYDLNRDNRLIEKLFPDGYKPAKTLIYLNGIDAVVNVSPGAS